MPLTPFHPVLPWIPYVRWPRAFSFWAITIGATVNDLEVVPMWLLSGDIHGARGVMHSVVGVLTLNAAITVLAVYVLVPPFLRWVARRWPDHPEVLRFAGQDLRRDPRDPLTVYASAAFGGLTHILVDVPTHAFNPLLWPWQTVPGAIVPFADDLWWDALLGIPLLVALGAMLYAFWRR